MGAGAHGRRAPARPPCAHVSVLVWVLIGMALWHFTVLLPDRFYGGIIGALIAAVAGAVVTGYALPTPGVPRDNPPGFDEAIWPVPGSLAALSAAYWWGSRAESDTE
jgi:hypothetical protein